MEIHKPKAAHSWREFLVEIGTIICGILIALALEQAVEWSHGQERLREVREQLHAEISSNVRAATMWLAMAPCLDREVSNLEAAVLAARASGRYAGGSAFSPSLIRFESEAWLNARALQVFDRVPTEQAKALSDFYFFSANMQTDVVLLHTQAGELKLLSHPLGRLAPSEVDDLLIRLGRAEELFTRMNLSSLRILQHGRRLDALPPSDVSRAHLESAIGPNGSSCVIEPMQVWDLVKTSRDDRQIWSQLHLPEATHSGR